MPPVDLLLAGEDRRAVHVAVVIDRPVIAGEDHHRVLGEPPGLEGLHDRARRPVQLDHRVAAVAQLALALEARMGRAGHVDVLGGEEEEEGLLVVLIDEARGPLNEHIRHGLVIPQRGLAAGHVADASDAVDDRLVVPVGARVVGHRLGGLTPVGVRRAALGRAAELPHVERVRRVEAHHPVALQVDARHAIVGRGQEEGLVEAELHGARLHRPVPIDGLTLRAQAEVPLANDPGAVPRRPERIRERPGINRDRQPRVRGEHPDAAAEAVHPGEQREARGRAGARRAVPVRESEPLGRQPVQVGGRDLLRAVAAEVPEAHVVPVDQDHVGALPGAGGARADDARVGRRRAGAEEQGEEGQGVLHGHHSSSPP